METTEYRTALDTVVSFASKTSPSVSMPADVGVRISVWGIGRSRDTLWSGEGMVSAGTADARPKINVDVVVKAYENVVSSTVDEVVAKVLSGTSSSTRRVVLHTATTGALIRYTLDGSTPDGESSTYSDTLRVPATGLLKACATLPGRYPSEVLVLDLGTITVQP